MAMTYANTKSIQQTASTITSKINQGVSPEEILKSAGIESSNAIPQALREGIGAYYTAKNSKSFKENLTTFQKGLTLAKRYECDCKAMEVVGSITGSQNPTPTDNVAMLSDDELTRRCESMEEIFQAAVQSSSFLKLLNSREPIAESFWGKLKKADSNERELADHIMSMEKKQEILALSAFICAKQGLIKGLDDGVEDKELASNMGLWAAAQVELDSILLQDGWHDADEALRGINEMLFGGICFLIIMGVIYSPMLLLLTEVNPFLVILGLCVTCGLACLYEDELEGAPEFIIASVDEISDATIKKIYVVSHQFRDWIEEKVIPGMNAVRERVENYVHKVAQNVVSVTNPEEAKIQTSERKEQARFESPENPVQA